MAQKLINLLPYPDEIKFHFANKGKRKKVVYVPGPSDRLGRPEFVPNGLVDVQDFIDASADDIDFKALGNVLVGTGGDVRHHFFSDAPITDVTQLPRNIHELSAMHNKLKKEFDQLPDGLRFLFNDDYESFIKAGKDGSIGQIFGDYYQAQASPAASEPGAAAADDKEGDK